jgi:hypothetical protein
MIRRDKDHKAAWIKYVANKLGFENMPHDMRPQAEILYERGWTAPETIEHFKECKVCDGPGGSAL